MSKGREDTRPELLEELKRAEESVARMRELRDAHTGAAREDLYRRVCYCERLLQEMREGVREVERDTLRLSVWKDLDQL